MRLDKYLKTARILKRREAAKELALQGRIWVNERVAKQNAQLLFEIIHEERIEDEQA